MLGRVTKDDGWPCRGAPGRRHASPGT
jgi:hypothetical protein